MSQHSTHQHSPHNSPGGSPLQAPHTSYFITRKSPQHNVSRAVQEVWDLELTCRSHRRCWKKCLVGEGGGLASAPQAPGQCHMGPGRGRAGRCWVLRWWTAWGKSVSKQQGKSPRWSLGILVRECAWWDRAMAQGGLGYSAGHQDEVFISFKNCFWMTTMSWALFWHLKKEQWKR